MEKHTLKGLRKTWGEKELIKARSKRGKGTSAPVKEELEVYERFIKIAQGNKKHIKTLILGATPEIRDLAIRLGSETTAIDISPRLLLALTNVMEYKDDFKNKYMTGDWLNMHKSLKPNSFDVVLADASFNNIPAKRHKDLFGIIRYLLKKEGYFITRNVVYTPPKQYMPVKYFIDKFNQGKKSVLGLIIEIGLFTKFAEKVYNRKTKKMPWGALYNMKDTIKKSLIKSEQKHFENLTLHAKYVVHYIFSRKEFTNIARKYFKVKDIKVVEEVGHSYLLPIFSFKAKKRILPDFKLSIERFLK